MLSLRTANSFTSRNICSAPPARALMLYHYSDGFPASQGTRSQLACFCTFLVTLPVQYSRVDHPLDGNLPGWPTLCGFAFRKGWAALFFAAVCQRTTRAASP